MNASSFLRRSALSIALLAGVGLVVPSISSAAEQQETCRKKRSKRISKKEKRALAKMKKEGRVTTKQIRIWQKRKLSDAKIVKLAYEIGYEDSAKRQKFLRKYKVRKSLRKALAAGPVIAKAQPKKPSGPEPIDLDATIDPEEIDFDSVPPPEGAEMATAWVSEDEEQRKKQKRVVAKPAGKRRVVVSRK